MSTRTQRINGSLFLLGASRVTDTPRCGEVSMNGRMACERSANGSFLPERMAELSRQFCRGVTLFGD